MKKAAIILAAGLGSRLRPLTDSVHKCMTGVCGVPIIFNALSNVRQCGITDVVIVVGYLAEKLKKQISGFDLDICIRFAENKNYENTNTSESLRIGLEYLPDDYDELYVLEGDVFFEKKVIDRIVNSDYENAAVLEPYNPELEGTFVTLGDENNITDWRHKSDQDETYIVEDKFKTVNIHKFSREFVSQQLMPAINKSISINGPKAPLEKTMRLIVAAEPNIMHGEILKGEKWFEIDNINDLHIAEKMFAGE